MAGNRRKPQTIDQDKIFLSPEELLAQSNQSKLQVLPGTVSGFDYEDDEDVDDVTALNTVLSELGVTTDAAKGFITVFKEKISSGQKTEDYLGKFAITEYANGNLLDHLQNTFGGGRYHIRVYAPGGRGMVLKANKFIDIAGDPKVVTANAPVAMPAAAADLSPVLAAINQQQQQQQANFERLITALAAGQPKQKTTAEMLEEMRLMREVFAPAGSAQPPVTQFMEAMKLGADMAAQMGAGGDGNNAWVSKIIETFGKPIMDAVISGQIKPDIPQQPARLLVPAMNATPVMPVQPTEDDNAMGMMMNGYLKMITKAAANNEPVDEYADTILNLIPDSQLPEFEAMIRAADWQVKLSAHAPAINQHAAWFTNLRNTLIEFMDADRATLESQQLTGTKTGASVISHENDNTGAPAQNSNAGGTA